MLAQWMYFWDSADWVPPAIPNNWNAHTGTCYVMSGGGDIGHLCFLLLASLMRIVC